MEFRHYTDDEIVHKIFQYEFEDFISNYERERDGGFSTNSSDCDDCIVYIPNQWPYDDNIPWEGPKVLITAPHATSQYRSSQTRYRHDCGISEEACQEAYEEDFDDGHNEGCCGKEPDNYTGAYGKLLSEITGVPAILMVRKDIDPNFYDGSNYGNSSHRIAMKNKIEEVISIMPSIRLVIDLHGADLTRPFNIDIGTGGDQLNHTSLDVGTKLWAPNGIPYQDDDGNVSTMRLDFRPGSTSQIDAMYTLREIAQYYDIESYDGEGGMPSNHTFSGWANDTVIKFTSGGTQSIFSWFERPAMQLELNEIFRTNVEGYANEEWRFYQPYGDNSVNPYLVKMVRTLAAFIWKVQTDVFPPPEPDVLWGDVNGDGQVNILDVVTLVQCILNGTDCGPNVDLNNDYNTDILDVIALINFIVAGDTNNFERTELEKLEKTLHDIESDEKSNKMIKHRVNNLLIKINEIKSPSTAYKQIQRRKELAKSGLKNKQTLADRLDLRNSGTKDGKSYTKKIEKRERRNKYKG